MNKIYWSKQQDPESWSTFMKAYYFPFAERLMRTKYGKRIVLWYLEFRSWFEKEKKS